MRTIWKYPLGIGDRDQAGYPVAMPAGGIIRHIGTQSENSVAAALGFGTNLGPIEVPMLWVEVDPDAETEIRFFRMVGTGDPRIEDDWGYVGSVQMDGFVWHFYEVAAS